MATNSNGEFPTYKRIKMQNNLYIIHIVQVFFIANDNKNKQWQQQKLDIYDIDSEWTQCCTTQSNSNVFVRDNVRKLEDTVYQIEESCI